VRFSEGAIRFWLLLVTVLMMLASIPRLAGLPLQDVFPHDTGPWMLAGLSVVTVHLLVGIAVCWIAFYSHLWKTGVTFRNERWVWGFALLSLPFGLLLYYFLIYRNRGRQV